MVSLLFSPRTDTLTHCTIHSWFIYTNFLWFVYSLCLWCLFVVDVVLSSVDSIQRKLCVAVWRWRIVQYMRGKKRALFWIRHARALMFSNSLCFVLTSDFSMASSYGKINWFRIHVRNVFFFFFGFFTFLYISSACVLLFTKRNLSLCHP